MKLKITVILLMLMPYMVHAEDIKSEGNKGYVYQTSMPENTSTKTIDQASDNDQPPAIYTFIKNIDDWIKEHIW